MHTETTTRSALRYKNKMKNGLFDTSRVKTRSHTNAHTFNVASYSIHISLHLIAAAHRMVSFRFDIRFDWTGCSDCIRKPRSLLIRMHRSAVVHVRTLAVPQATNFSLELSYASCRREPMVSRYERARAPVSHAVRWIPWLVSVSHEAQ